MPSLFERFQKGWDAFRGREPTQTLTNIGGGYSYRPDKLRKMFGSEKSIVNSIQTRIAVDVAAVTIQHVRVGEDGRFDGIIRSPLNDVLNVEANKDQTGRELIQDIIQSVCDEGVVAVVPVLTDVDPTKNESFDIYAARVGKITEWFPDHVRVNLYDDRTGHRRDKIFPKSMVLVITNPLYSVMNEPNSTLQRLKHKLALMDSIDEQTSASKLDLIIQLPYVIKSEARKKQAEERRKDIEMQLAGSKYGVAYTDGTEKVVQLNRSLENNLLAQVQYLTTQAFNQLGITEEVFNGTADEATMLNYYNRTIEPFLAAIALEMRRKWLTKKERSHGQDIMYFNNPFKLVPVNQMAEIADKFIRNEILSKNEFRAILGMKGSDDPKADELRNPNLNQSPDAPEPVRVGDEGLENQNDS